MDIKIYIFSLYIAFIIAIGVSYTAWKRRATHGALALTVMMLAIAIWDLFQALMFSTVSIETKFFFAKMRFWGIETVPIAFFVFAHEYLNKTLKYKFKSWLKFLVLPSVAIVFVWTNSLHFEFYKEVYLENKILMLTPGAFFWINMVYLYTFIMASVVLFVRAIRTLNPIYRTQSIIMIFASLIPLSANLIFNLNIFEQLAAKNMDITPIAFLLSGILFFYAMFQYRLLDLVPVARELLFEEMDDAVIVVDKEKRIIDLNKKARELILSEWNNSNDIIGESILDVLEDWGEASEPEFRSKKIVYTKSGNYEYYHMKTSDFKDKYGNDCGTLIVFRNITELEKALQQANLAKDEAENATRLKSDFLANMSHEIRTPMNAVIGITELLETEDFTIDQQKKYLKMVSDSAQSLMIIINDILDLSKIEAGKIELRKEIFNLNDLIKSSVETFSVLAINKSLLVSDKIDEELNCAIIGDYDRIRQILINLVGNAIKFTAEGFIKVEAKLIEKDDDFISVNFNVVDSGIGIDEDKINTIFESFRQLDNSTSRNYHGTGLGLTIVKNLVEIMGGSITVKSKIGIGSSFTFNLRFELPKEQAQKRVLFKGNTAYANCFIGKKILVAEDNKINREIISIQLKKFGCEFDFAENGEIALCLFKNSIYDIILMDVQMPVMDGLEATRKIRNMEKDMSSHTKIIALTAGVMKNDIDRCMEAGMDAYISKPVKIDKIYHAINDLINLK